MELKEITITDDLTHVALKGRLDISGVQDVELKFANIVGQRGKPTIVDLSEVEFLASLGMRMLLSVAKALKARGTKMVLLNPQPAVEEALETAGFGAVLAIEKDFDQALTLLN
jgi:anti-anti-sigma factor